jgi:4-hydroxybenzoate polyprenyltransferase
LIIGALTPPTGTPKADERMQISAWLQLVRWKNLLIVCATQLLLWYCVILPLHPLLLEPANMLLFSLCTLLIAAAGYIINDYFDLKIDALNRPQKVVLGKLIAPKRAIIAHFTLNILALVIAFYLAQKMRHPLFALFQLACTVLLWYYSTHFKRQFIIGNVVVAFLTAFTLMLMIIYEPSLWLTKGFPKLWEVTQRTMPFLIICFVAYFAFFLTWIREIVKDMEDFKGDAAEGCKTLPITWGLRKAKVFVLVLQALVVLPLAFAGLLLHNFLGYYILLCIALPLLIWTAFFFTQSTTLHFALCSKYLKIIMLLGIGLLLVYRFQLYLIHAA